MAALAKRVRQRPFRRDFRFRGSSFSRTHSAHTSSKLCILVRKSATVVAMLSSEWQAAQDPADPWHVLQR